MNNTDKPIVANLPITHCSQCPFLEMKRHYTADSFEHEYNWYCKKKNDKVIENYVSWNEEKDVKIPKWCPLAQKPKD